jgi:8-oxo-dGTP diphosphatase
MILATLCYVKKDDHTLMLHRVKKQNDFHEGKWNGLGGKFEKGETPEQCVIREVNEESGLRLRSLHYHGLLLFAGFNNDDWYVWVYSSDDFEGELMDNPPEGDLKWIPDEQVGQLNLWPSDAIFLPWLKQDRRFSARFQFDYDTFIDHTVTFFDERIG